MSDMYKAKKGWIITADENGKNVPFFVYVRSKDIQWGSTSFPDEAKVIAQQGYNAVTLAPQAHLKFTYRDWAISIAEDLSFEATLRLSIGNSAFVMDDGVDVTLYQTVNLPLKAVYDDSFSIQTTIQGNNEETKTAYSGVDVVQDENKNVTGVKIELNNQILKFHKTFANIKSYLNSYVYVTIKGTIATTSVTSEDDA